MGGEGRQRRRPGISPGFTAHSVILGAPLFRVHIHIQLSRCGRGNFGQWRLGVCHLEPRGRRDRWAGHGAQDRA